LEGESTSEENCERADLLAGLIEIETERGAEASRLRSQAADGWNRIVPSWREVALLVVPTLLSACGACQYQLDFMKPIAFQSSCAACITFTIVFFFLCFLSNRRHKGRPLSCSGDVRFKTPAIVAIVLVVLMMIVAYVAFLSRTAEIKSRQVKETNDIKLVYNFKGPLLARPAGAKVLLLATSSQATTSPVGLSNRKGSYALCNFAPCRASRQGEPGLSGTFSNLKTYAHVGQANMGRDKISIPPRPL